MHNAASRIVPLVTLLVALGAPAQASWQTIPGKAQDIGVGPDGIVWVIGGPATAAPPGSRNFAIFRRDGSAWTKMPGAAIRISAGPGGIAWIVNAGGDIYRWAGSKWQRVPGGGSDIGVGTDGSVWVIDDQGSIWRLQLNGTSWDRMPGGAVRVAVDPKGAAWVINRDGNIYRWNGKSFDLVPGSAHDIGIGANGMLWIVGRDGTVYRRDGEAWTNLGGGAASIAVSPAGEPWITRTQTGDYAIAKLPRPAATAGMAAIPVGPVAVIGTIEVQKSSPGGKIVSQDGTPIAGVLDADGNVIHSGNVRHSELTVESLYSPSGRKGPGCVPELTTKALQEPHRWMAHLWPCIEHTSLRDMVLPGSHDSGTWDLATHKLPGTTQGSDLYSQLRAGARWFDLRVKRFVPKEHSTLRLFPLPWQKTDEPRIYDLFYHGPAHSNTTFQTGLQQIQKFLKENPEEIVILVLTLREDKYPGSLHHQVYETLKECGIQTMPNLAPFGMRFMQSRVLLVQSSEIPKGYRPFFAKYDDVIRELYPGFTNDPNHTDSNIPSGAPGYTRGKYCDNFKRFFDNYAGYVLEDGKPVPPETSAFYVLKPQHRWFAANYPKNLTRECVNKDGWLAKKLRTWQADPKRRMNVVELDFVSSGEAGNEALRAAIALNGL